MPAKSLNLPGLRLYEEDFLAWTQETARLLRAGRFGELDVESLIEEIESMGKSQGRELDSRLLVLIQHLLKWKYQPGMRPGSWGSTLITQRHELSRLLQQSPSLQPGLRAAVSTAYPVAVRAAGAGTGLPPATFPAHCPFTPEQILDPDFLPE